MNIVSGFDERALEAHRVALRGHCYRMLGSVSEAEDALQDALVKAWQRRDQWEGRAPLRAWLQRIATRVCLDHLESRTRRCLPWNLGPPAASLEAPLVAREGWLEPMPDALVVPDDADPAERVILRQSIRLAFLAALQHLPGRQRAALLLTEVLGWSVADVAECLESSVPAINSALQRARATLAERRPSTLDAAATTPEQDRIVARYVEAFERYDMAALAEVIRADATMQMPPFDLWLRGLDDIQAWLVGRGAACRGSRLVPVEASGSPSFAQYKPDPAGGFSAWSLIVLELEGLHIVGIHHFLDTAALFPRFGLPLQRA